MSHVGVQFLFLAPDLSSLPVWTLGGSVMGSCHLHGRPELHSLPATALTQPLLLWAFLNQ